MLDEESQCSTKRGSIVRHQQIKFDDVFQDDEESEQSDKLASRDLWDYSRSGLTKLLDADAAQEPDGNMDGRIFEKAKSHEKDTLFSSPTVWLSSSKRFPNKKLETEAETEGETEDESRGSMLINEPIEILEECDDEDDDDRPALQRLVFLENLKVALIFIMISHHVTCAFGGYGSSWLFVVGLYDNPFRKVASVIAILDQGYFMPLFFFIYAYVTPYVYDLKGRHDFSCDNAKRLWIPLVFMTFLVYPLLIMYCQWFSGAQLNYMPTFGHTWFLMWILALAVVYTHVRESYSSPDQSAGPATRVSLPSANARCFYGFVVCGLGMFGIILLLRDNMFAAMPISIGSLANNLFMFCAGIVAGKNHWLEKSLRKQLDVCIGELRLLLVVEAGMMCWFLLKFLETRRFWFVCAGVGISGMYCLDMSLVMLDLFQTFFSFQTRLSKALADAAYTVYLIHPIVVTGFVSLWIYIYKAMGYGKIEFEDNFHSSTPIEGDCWTLALSWFLVNLASHIVVWPLAQGIRRLPLLREIL